MYYTPEVLGGLGLDENKLMTATMIVGAVKVYLYLSIYLSIYLYRSVFISISIDLSKYLYICVCGVCGAMK